MVVTARRAFKRRKQFLRRIKIGESLREIDRAMLVRHPRGAADDGLGECGKPMCWKGHVEERDGLAEASKRGAEVKPLVSQ